jgi:hypothetical protein
MNDWLDDAETAVARAQLEQKSLEVSRLYLVFETHPQAKQLLAMWEDACSRKRTPINAPHTQYAADEAIRSFVAGIRNEIAKARQASEFLG